MHRSLLYVSVQRRRQQVKRSQFSAKNMENMGPSGGAVSRARFCTIHASILAPIGTPLATRSTVCLVILGQHLPSSTGCHCWSACPTSECMHLCTHKTSHSSVPVSLYRSFANFHNMVLIRSLWRWLKACLISNPPSKYDTCECSIRTTRFEDKTPSHGSCYVVLHLAIPLSAGRTACPIPVGKYCSI